MDKQKEWIKKFKDKFGFIAHKGIQCDEITLQNMVDFISEEAKDCGHKQVNYNCKCWTDGFRTGEAETQILIETTLATKNSELKVFKEELKEKCKPYHCWEWSGGQESCKHCKTLRHDL